MIYNYINKKFGIKFFNNPNTLNYNLFNYFLRRNIKKNIKDDLMKKYHEEGYLNTKINSKELSIYLSNEIKKQNPAFQEKSFVFNINSEMREKIKEHIKKYYIDILNKFKIYYGKDIIVSNVELRRNYGLKYQDDYKKTKKALDREFYSNYFHCDHYTMNYFKLFINIHDTSDEHGPLNFYNLKDTKEFVKNSNYKSRNNYKELQFSKLKKNIGNIGDSIFLNTSLCIHKAGVPVYNKHRDMLMITFVAPPSRIEDLFYYDRNEHLNIWEENDLISKKYSKPKNLRNTVRLYYQLK